MKNTFLGALAVFSGLTGQATAQSADTDWSGFYGGVNLAYNYGAVDWIDQNGGWFSFIPGTAFSQDYDGVSGGIQLGHNWQSGSMVYGVELGVNSLGLEETVTSPRFPGSDTWSTSIDNMAALMGRLGQANGNWLTYLEAGLAAGQVGLENVGRVFCAPLNCVFSGDELMIGAAIGIGFDYRVSARSSVGISLRHLDLGTATFSGTTINNGTAESYSVSGVADIVSLRWNMHF